MSATISGILAIIQSLPALLKLFEAIGKAVEAGEHNISINLELRKLDKAIDTAKTTKDTSSLEDLFKLPPNLPPKH